MELDRDDYKIQNKDYKAPIVLFVYNRPETLKITLDSLKNNLLISESELYIFSDGPKNEEDKRDILKVRKVIRKIDWCKRIEIIENTENLGCAKSVIQGVNYVFEKYNEIIVLEDDLELSPAFLTYMNSCLKHYSDNKNIHTISGFIFRNFKYPFFWKDTFLYTRHFPCGWAIWKDRWVTYDMTNSFIRKFFRDKRNIIRTCEVGKELYKLGLLQLTGFVDAWDIIMILNIIHNYGYAVYPKKSLLKHIGEDSKSTHVKSFSVMHKPSLWTTVPSRYNFSNNKRFINYIKSHFNRIYNNKVSLLSKLFFYLIGFKNDFQHLKD